jgi:hypothetical protein
MKRVRAAHGGVINGFDFGQFKSRFGTMFP